MSNPNCLFVESDHGGHCFFFSKTNDKDHPYEMHFSKVALDYFEGIASYENKEKQPER